MKNKFLLIIFASIVLIVYFYHPLKYSLAKDTQDELSGLFWPPPPAEPRIFFVKNISGYEDMGIKKSIFGHIKDLLFGKKRYSFFRPMALAVGREGVLYIADTGSGTLCIYRPKKKLIESIREIDKQISLISPVGIGVSEDGLIFVADSYLGKVFAIDSKGVSHFILGEKEGILRPTGIFVKDEKLYVVDTESCQIFVFDLKGKGLFRFGKKGKGEGEFNSPTSIYVDTNDRILVSDTLNFRVQIFDSKGTFLKSIGSIGDSSGHFSRPKGVAVDSFGHIYVVDGMFDNIQIFDYRKNFLLSFGTAGDGQGEFWLPAGIAIDKDNYIYIADSYNQRISIFRYVGEE